MALQANIDNDKVDNFSKEAKIELQKQLEKYCENIIKESNLIEEAMREDGAITEITSNIVLQAVRRNKTNHNKKPNKFLLITKIVSALSLLISGFLFDEDGGTIKLIFFLIVFAIACASTVLQFVLDYKEWCYEYNT